MKRTYLGKAMATINGVNTATIEGSNPIVLQQDGTNFVISAPTALEHIMDNGTNANPHNITKAKIGLSEVENYSVDNMPPTYIRTERLERLISGETFSEMGAKLATAVDVLNANIPHYGVCNTTADESTKIIEIRDYSQEVGSSITVKFIHNNVAENVLLKINDTEAKPIKQSGDIGDFKTYTWDEGSIIEFIYDGNNYVMNNGTQAKTNVYGLTKLSNDIDSDSEVLASTPKAVKRTWQFADNITSVAPISFNPHTESGRVITHDNSGVVAASKGDNDNQTPGFGDTFKSISATVNEKGHVTVFDDHTVRIPDAVVTQSSNGLMTKEDKKKLDVIAYGTSTTAANTATKVVSVETNAGTNFILQKGSRIVIKFTNGNTVSDVKLNVNNTGAKLVKQNSANDESKFYSWDAGSIIEFIYDGTDFYIDYGTQASTSVYGTTKLSNAIDSTSEVLAATPKAVKRTFDFANNISATSPISFTGNESSRVITHDDSGVTAASKGDTSNQTPGFGSTFKVPSLTVNSKGHVTVLNDHTVKIPTLSASATITSGADIGSINMNGTSVTFKQNSRMYLGANNATADATSDVSNPYIRLFNNTTFADDIQIAGSTYLTAVGKNGVVTLTHKAYTATTGTPDGNKSPGFGGTFTVNQINTDTGGHVTSNTSRTITMPSISDSTTSSSSTVAASSKAVNDLRMFKIVKVGTTNIEADSNADTLTLTAGTDMTLTPDATTDNVTFTHSNSGVTAASKGDTSNQTPGFGGTFKVPSGTVNARGHLTAFADHTVTIPSTNASTSVYGITKLYSGVDSNSEALGATPKAVKTAYDYAVSHAGNTSNPHSTTKAQVGLGNVANIDQSKAIKGITRSGTTFTYTCLDGTTGTFTQQDNNTTYSLATTTANGLMSATDFKKINPQEIPANANLNDYTAIGLYVCKQNATALTLANRPTSNAFTMVVLQHAGTYQFIQEYMTSSAKAWHRNYYNSAWGNWVEHKWTDTNTWRDVVNNLTSNDTSKSLAASQGPVIAKAIKSISRSGTTFTYTCLDGTTGTFTQQDNNTTYTFTNKAATLAWNTAVTIATVGGTDITVKLPANPNTDTTYSAGSGIKLSGTTFSVALKQPDGSIGGEGALTYVSGRTYAVTKDQNQYLAVNVPWTDTTYSANNGISLSGTIFSNSGVRSISTGSSNGTISVNTNGTSADVSVKGLGSAAYTASTTYAASSHNHSADNITSGILPVGRGGTGNTTGYVTAGKKSDSTLGTRATAEGYSTTASSNYCHAEGKGTTASHQASHAEGESTIAGGMNSHSEGRFSNASAEASHAEGYGVENNSFYVVALEEFINKYPTASGQGSHAEGYGSIIASGNGAHAEGYGTETSPNRASGQGSHTEGQGTTASGKYSHAEGESTTASGIGAHAEGYITTASGGYSHAEGYNTFVYTYGSHAEGYGSVAGKEADTNVLGIASHAEGFSCDAKGYYSHAEGYNTTANTNGTHSEGYSTQANGMYSHAGGEGTVAQGYTQTAIGSYNIINDNKNDALFIIGKGSSSTRANAFRVGYTASWAAGTMNASGADYAELFEWEDKNPNNEDRCGLFVTLENDKIRLVNSKDNFILGIISGNPTVLGDVYDDQWKGMYEYDIFGRCIFENVEVPEKKETITIPKVITKTIQEKEIQIDEETGEEKEVLVDKEIEEVIEVEEEIVLIPAHIEHRQKLNPGYDSSKKYIPRSERPEWSAVGMIGKLVAIDDSSCVPNGWCKPSDGGVATFSETETKYRVMKRIDNSHIQIFIRP